MQFLAYFPYFEKDKSRHSITIYVSIPHSINFRITEQIFMKSDMDIMVLEPISTEHFINHFHKSVCLYVYLPIVAWRRLSKNVTAATKTHTIEELFYMRSVTYQR
jgi:hypothetical protein